MPLRLVALDEGPDIVVDRAVVVVGRHPQCDARLDSIRVSRRHCCMTPDNGELVVRDLGSTNGIRINGQRVEMGRVRPGDELSIAHIRFRLDALGGQEPTLAGVPAGLEAVAAEAHRERAPLFRSPVLSAVPAAMAAPVVANGENALAAEVRRLLPPSLADRCHIKVIVRMDDEGSETPESVEKAAESCPPDSSP